MGRARENPAPTRCVSRAVIRMSRLFILYWIAAAIVLAACTPHPDTARRALLERGLGQIKLGEASIACMPRVGIRFTAVDPAGTFTSGRVCCDGLACDVAEDQAR